MLTERGVCVRACVLVVSNAFNSTLNTHPRNRHFYPSSKALLAVKGSAFILTLAAHKPGLRIWLRLNPSKTVVESMEVGRLWKIPILLRCCILFQQKRKKVLVSPVCGCHSDVNSFEPLCSISPGSCSSWIIISLMRSEVQFAGNFVFYETSVRLEVSGSDSYDARVV
jgi:hypothetical protein